MCWRIVRRVLARGQRRRGQAARRFPRNEYRERWLVGPPWPQLAGIADMFELGRERGHSGTAMTAHGRHQMRR
ncbi:hypothetical protein [Gordonia hongkongensis]|uniref:Transposase n=1 Tax=Gordonia hongkongensis TaxID=1701090 RepID=A0ABT6BYG4_9ACTN|nr:hypothetical protein [Gordonia hongkongensis]MDF6103053.1 hypothetical protein [Gordonia hongkongensis]